jgi:phosphatidylserine/phosphatidylglycerophosphate/cardiolipin synthase-like enzyme
VIVVVPATTDQPFGELRRSGVIEALRDEAVAAGNPGMVRIGSPRRRFTVPTASLRASSGRLRLAEDVGQGDELVALGPEERVPPVPFWIAVDGELMWVYDEAPSHPPRYRVVRGDDTRIVSGVPAPGRGATPREHRAGAAATVVNLDGIYVHAKLTIVDDMFLGVGSANLNRRGFYSDGECNLFVVPEALRAGPANPVRALRRRLWSEMLDLPAAFEPLLDDPVAAGALFERSYLHGNRFVPANASPVHVVRNFAGGDGLVASLLNHLGVVLLTGSEVALFDTVVDPGSALDPDAP